MPSLPGQDPSIQNTFARMVFSVPRLVRQDFSRKRIDIDAAFTQDHKSMMPFEHRSIGFRFQRTRASGAKRLDDLRGRDCAKSLELHGT